MLPYYGMLFLAVLFLAAQFAMNKLFQSKNGSGMETSLLYTAATGAAAALIFLVISGSRVKLTPFSLLCAVGIAALCLGYNLLGFRIFSLGSYAVFNLFLMAGGMILPFLYGMLFLGDADAMSAAAVVCRSAGVLILVGAMALTGLAGKEGGGHDAKKRGLFFALCAAVFCMNGFVSILSKLHQIADFAETVDGNSFVFLTNLLSGIGSGAALLILMKKGRKPALAEGYAVRTFLLTAGFCALCSGLSYLLQLFVAASPLPASVQYPMLTGGSIVLSALAGRVLFGEKPSKPALAGILAAFAATFLFLV